MQIGSESEREKYLLKIKMIVLNFVNFNLFLVIVMLFILQGGNIWFLKKIEDFVLRILFVVKSLLVVKLLILK